LTCAVLQVLDKGVIVEVGGFKELYGEYKSINLGSSNAYLAPCMDAKIGDALNLTAYLIGAYDYNNLSGIKKMFHI
jgi:hypothetical protein